MPEYSPRGYELPLGTDPIASGDNAMYANWTQLDGEITALEDQAIVRGTFSGTTDATNGILTISAASLGLAAVTGCAASVQFTPSGGTAMLCAARTSSGNAQIMIYGVNPLTGGTVSRLPNTAVTVHLIAWGTKV